MATRLRQKNLLALALTAAAALLFTAPPAEADSSANIIRNGNFEEPNSNGSWPEHWGKPKSGGSWEQEDGKRFVRLRSSQPGEMVMLYSRHPLPKNIEALELSWDWRINNLQRGEAPWFDARFIYEFLDKDLKKIAQKPTPSYRNSDTKGWEGRKASFLVPKEAAVLVIMPTVFQAKSGTMDIDNLVLKPTDPAPLREAALKRQSEEARRHVDPEAENRANWPKELHVKGTKILDTDGNAVMLRGLSTSGLETLPHDRQPPRSVLVGIDEWKANVMRIPVNESHWFGRNVFQKDGGKAYREMIDFLVTLAANRGSYLIIDLHRFRAPREEHIEFWADVANRYKNHPAVIFELFNEPHGISWEIWRNGGFVGEKLKPGDEDAFLDEDELKKLNKGFESVGMQALVKAVRDTGAKNLILAGGLQWSYDLSGLPEYALDDLGGNGIIYGWHVYNWHKGWESRMLEASKHYPILVGEFGADTKKMDFIPHDQQEDPYTWAPDILGFIEENGLHFTAWCFHPRATPVMISDWEYTPTPFWGAFVKRALAGEKFKMKRTR